MIRKTYDSRTRDFAYRWSIETANEIFATIALQFHTNTLNEVMWRELLMYKLFLRTWLLIRALPIHGASSATHTEIDLMNKEREQ